jgi:hypothetical protein
MMPGSGIARQRIEADLYVIDHALKHVLLENRPDIAKNWSGKATDS